MIKLICIDMDGTLLNSHHEISEENKAAIKRATEKGIKVALTTGRIFCSARYYSKLLGVETPVIASNGAYIREQDTEDIIYSNTIPAELILKVHSIVKKYGLNINYNTSNTLISEKEMAKDHTYRVMNEALEEKDRVIFYEAENIDDILEGFDGQILKGIVIEEERLEELKSAKEELISELGGELHIVSSWYNNFEIMLNNSTKGCAVKMLAQNYGIAMEDVMCIGDSENDLSMIEVAGIPVAMGNAIDKLKSKANFITESNDNSGVAKAIKKYLQNS